GRGPRWWHCTGGARARLRAVLPGGRVAVESERRCRSRALDRVRRRRGPRRRGVGAVGVWWIHLRDLAAACEQLVDVGSFVYKEELGREAKAQQLRYGVVQIARLALTSLSSGSQSTSATSTAPERCERPGLSSSGSWPFGWCAAARATLAWLHCGLAFPAA